MLAVFYLLNIVRCLNYYKEKMSVSWYKRHYQPRQNNPLFRGKRYRLLEARRRLLSAKVLVVALFL